MKKKCFVLLCAALFALAPAALADEGADFSLDGLFDSLVAIFLGLDGNSEMPWQMPPGGHSLVEDPGAAANLPSNNSAPTPGEVEMGWQCPPGG